MNAQEYFINPRSTAHRQFCALTAYYKDCLPAREVAPKFGYTLSSFYSLVQEFKTRLETSEDDPFFLDLRPGRKTMNSDSLEILIVNLRKRNFSNADISKALGALGIPTSQPQIWRILDRHGFRKLRRRSEKDRQRAKSVCLLLKSEPETIEANNSNIEMQGGNDWAKL